MGDKCRLRPVAMCLPQTPKGLYVVWARFLHKTPSGFGVNAQKHPINLHSLGNF
jgi:hypothetical protein